ncbi:hypothetical protein CDEST_15013 [Colletotrichum destructivum]|uniref:Uncharacterized protein n=1 Tax=Colletotrichum destructivum TaxID=34406 RepID=A0AAX4J337_9PEZI|nr:hypothetical protein CDEST_15013 [Colletotrichum destructivum]
MLFSAHASQVLIALSLLSSPLTLAKPVATTSAPVMPETKSLIVWEPLYESATALDKRESGFGRFVKRWGIVTLPIVVISTPSTIYSIYKDCKQFSEEKDKGSSVSCVAASVNQAISIGTAAIAVFTIVFTYVTGESPLKSRNNFLSLEDPQPAAAFPAIEAPLIAI